VNAREPAKDLAGNPADSARPAFRLRGIDLTRAGTPILAGLDATIPDGCATAVVGPSGSGKSTLLRLLNRFEDPDRGVVEVAGVDARTLDVLALRRRVGLVAQHPVMLADSLATEIRVGVPDLPDAAVSRLLAAVSLDHLDPQRPTAGLSGGETQRLALARALALEPEALLLDEPTSALDATAADVVDAVVAALVQSGLTAVIVSHDLTRLRDVVGHTIVLEQGSVVEEGPPGDMKYLRD
jgi:putative ABC transport system ATP-binding protein